MRQEDFYPSVTWICSYYPKGYGFEKWLADKGMDKAEEIKNEAGQKGTRVHHVCEEMMHGIEINMSDKYADKDGEQAELTADEYWTAMTFRKFLEDEQPVVYKTEYTVLNHEYKYGGTVDIKCRIKSDGYKFIHIIDIKTSKSIYPSHEMQVSAYKKTDPECEKIDILQVGYRLNKNGYKLTPIDDQFDLFLATYRVWQKEQSTVLVPQREYPLSLTWKPIKDIPEVVEPVAKPKKTK